MPCCSALSCAHTLIFILFLHVLQSAVIPVQMRSAFCLLAQLVANATFM